MAVIHSQQIIVLDEPTKSNQAAMLVETHKIFRVIS